MTPIALHPAAFFHPAPGFKPPSNITYLRPRLYAVTDEPDTRGVLLTLPVRSRDESWDDGPKAAA